MAPPTDASGEVMGVGRRGGVPWGWGRVGKDGGVPGCWATERGR